VLSQALLDADKPLTSKYGAVVGLQVSMRQAGMCAVLVLVLGLVLWTLDVAPATALCCSLSDTHARLAAISCKE
jgi:hypothetical protein